MLCPRYGPLTYHVSLVYYIGVCAVIHTFIVGSSVLSYFEAPLGGYVDDLVYSHIPAPPFVARYPFDWPQSISVLTVRDTSLDPLLASLHA